MARKVIEEVTCDACAKKGAEAVGTVILTIEEDRYDLCAEHGARFRTLLGEALGPAADESLSA